MKRKLLFLTPPLLLGLLALLSPSRDEAAKSTASEESSVVVASNRSKKVSRNAEIESVGWNAIVAEGAPGINVVTPKELVPENLSEVELANIPAGVLRVDEVVFESRTFEKDGTVRRSRILKTDFHYPYLRTVEWLKTDAASGEEKIVGYRSMVADHILLQLDMDAAPANWMAELEAYGLRVRREIANDGLLAMEFDLEGADQVSSLAEDVADKIDWVEFAEPDFVVAARSHQTKTPNDPMYPFLWGMNNTGQFGGTAGMDIGAAKAWGTRTDASDVIVAVVDSGINYRHLDLKENMWVNPLEVVNGRDDSGSGIADDIHGASFVFNDGDPMDFNGHGTHVAGTIGAVGNNQRGVAGVAWNVQLMAVQVLGAGGGGTTSGVIQGIDYAWQNGAEVLNMSLGMDHYGRSMSDIPSRAMAGAINRAERSDVIVVVAAGNDANDVDIMPNYPVYYRPYAPNQVNVGAMDPYGNPSFFSNYGIQGVDVFAPGSAIVSTYIGGDDVYAALDGTSMAAPHIAGMFAILKAEFPDEPYNVLIERLLQRSTADRHLTPYANLGRRANLAAALDPSPLIFAPLQDQEFLPEVPVTFSIAVSGPGAKTYRWFKDGATISGQASSSLTIASPGTNDLGSYRVEVSSPLGTSFSEASLFEVDGMPEIGAALGAQFLSWSTTESAPWTVSAGAGVESSAIGDNAASELSTTVTGPGTLTFTWSVSSEYQYDLGRFMIDGQVAEAISGESGVLSRTHQIPPGSHKLAWHYSKDGSRSVGTDSLHLHLLSYNSDFPVIVGQSRSIEIASGDSLDLSFEAIGAAPLNFYWQKNGEVFGAAGAVLSLADVIADSSGTYVGVAANSHGVTMTQPIVVTVVETARPAEFKQQPQSYVGLAGVPVVISTTWAATSPYEARWYKDGEPLEATGPVLTLSSPLESDSGSYSLIVTNGAGSSESFPATVKIYPAQVTFAEWLAENGGESEEAALLQFALGVTDSGSSQLKTPVFAIASEPTMELADALEGTDEPTQANNYASLRFSIPVNGIGIEYILEASDDLREWRQVESSLEFIGDPNGLKQPVQLRELEPLSSSQSRFLRLKIQAGEASH